MCVVCVCLTSSLIVPVVSPLMCPVFLSRLISSLPVRTAGCEHAGSCVGASTSAGVLMVESRGWRTTPVPFLARARTGRPSSETRRVTTHASESERSRRGDRALVKAALRLSVEGRAVAALGGSRHRGRERRPPPHAIPSTVRGAWVAIALCGRSAGRSDRRAEHWASTLFPAGRTIGVSCRRRKEGHSAGYTEAERGSGAEEAPNVCKSRGGRAVAIDGTGMFQCTPAQCVINHGGHVDTDRCV